MDRVVEGDDVVEDGVDDDSCFSLVNACKAEEHMWMNHRGECVQSRGTHVDESPRRALEALYL